MAMPMFDIASAMVSVKWCTGRHLLHIEAYSAEEAFPGQVMNTSSSFNIGGRDRCMCYFPHGASGGDKDYISVLLVLVDNNPEPAYAEATFHLLDRQHKPVPAYTQTTGFNKYIRTIPGIFVCKHDIHTFIKREVLKASSSEYLVHDCLKIRCDVTVKMPCYTENRGHVPPSDLHRHLEELLVSKQGADVTFQVADETFSAHRSILAARSRVLKEKLCGTATAAASCCVIRINDMLPRVFQAFLHFVYTDSLPEEVMIAGQDEDNGSMAYHLLEAAVRYDMQRLKLICEEKSCWHVEINTAATMLMFAQQHRCYKLKKACVDFLRCPQALNAVMATEGFQHLVQTCLTLLKNLISAPVRVN